MSFNGRARRIYESELFGGKCVDVFNTIPLNDLMNYNPQNPNTEVKALVKPMISILIHHCILMLYLRHHLSILKKGGIENYLNHYLFQTS